MNQKFIDLLNTYTFIVADESGICLSSEKAGIRPPLDALLANADALRGKSVIDKVIGKAAAGLAAYGSAKECHGHLMSEAGLQMLKAAGISASYDTLVPFIENRDHTGTCPMEQLVASCQTPEECFRALAAFFRDKPAQ